MKCYAGNSGSVNFRFFIVNYTMTVFFFTIKICNFNSILLKDYIKCYSPYLVRKLTVKPGSHCVVFEKSFRIILVRLYEYEDHVTLWDLSCD